MTDDLSSTTEQPMAFEIKVGKVSITVVVESCAPLLALGEIFPAATEEMLADIRTGDTDAWFEKSTDKLVVAIQGFVVRSEGKTIVVDTCVGDCKSRVREAFDHATQGWLKRLADSGTPPEHVDFVVSTHFHVDHVGGHTRGVEGRWQPSFPNARYLFVEAELDFWQGEGGLPGIARTGNYMDDSITPILDAGLADIVAGDHRITTEVRLTPTPGHSPGHVCVVIESEGERAILSGDMFHSPLQCRYPELSTRFCDDPAKSAATRMRFFEENFNQSTLVIPAHFPFPTAGHLCCDGRGKRFRFLDPGALAKIWSSRFCSRPDIDS
ncbi:putative quorum-quenching lactonase YtnP [Pandoraea anapnoica]|uniref:Putative quorum-quenching lactonase YtnP n=1 Tax=Pandoraea anapnoica TaxID=2508301 RepID=A0A5E5AES7_9BURK|nr:MBL fold metallo-hydrolase [Pandoraea anapnoica]VVE71708.1 putative quorum-quenching lactonase YtnP [Pandoraea anapnoica]